MADALPVFALSSEHRVIPADRSAGARGAALRTRGVPDQKRRKLEGFVVQCGLPLAEAVPLFAALLSLPLPGDYTLLTVSPEQQKQQTLHAPRRSR